MTAAELQLAKQYNLALLSVYYHGRRDEAPLRGQPPPLGVQSLARAVSVLASAPVSAQRLALTDLCRTRAKKSTPTVVAQMTNLAVAYERTTMLMRQPTAETIQPALSVRPTMLEKLNTIFTKPITPEAAYLEAIQMMVSLESPRRDSVPVLVGYSVSQQ
jgi:hypothetical protein